MSFPRIARRVLIVVSLLFCAHGTAAAADGVGRMVAAPERVTAGSTGNTITFTYTADSAALNGQLMFDVAPAWSPPQTRNGSAPGYVTLQNGTCAGATRISAMRGRRIVIAAACGRGREFTLTYANVTAPYFASEGFTFLTQTKQPARRTRNRKPRRARFLPLAPEKQPIVIVGGGPVAGLAVVATAVTTAGVAFSATVRAVDVYGNTAPSYTGTIVFASTDPGATLPPPYVFAGTDGGSHIFTGLILRTPGAQTIRIADAAGRVAETAPINVYAWDTGPSG